MRIGGPLHPGENPSALADEWQDADQLRALVGEKHCQGEPSTVRCSKNDETQAWESMGSRSAEAIASRSHASACSPSWSSDMTTWTSAICSASRDRGAGVPVIIQGWCIA